MLKVSATAQHINVAKNKDLKIGDTRGYDDRRKYYDLMKIIFDYENCK